MTPDEQKLAMIMATLFRAAYIVCNNKADPAAAACDAAAALIQEFKSRNWETNLDG